jgi:uncharacterized protein with FMN-binding domain
MSKSSLLTFAVLLGAFGVAILTGNPPWGLVTGVSMLLTAAAMAAGALLSKESAEDLTGKPAGQKIPPSLVTLSASAILAVYAAGYQRTRIAAEKFDLPTARHSTPAAAIVEPPKSTLPANAPPSSSTQTAPATVATAPKPSAPTTPAPAPNAETASAQSEAAPAAAPEPPRPAQTPTPAPSVTVATQPTPPVSAAKPSITYKDGTFSGLGSCRHGTIQASVAVQEGKIVSATITECRTRYSCSWIAMLPNEVVTRQSAEVDYVSGATESTDAFYEAVAAALSSARE